MPDPAGPSDPGLPPCKPDFFALLGLDPEPNIDPTEVEAAFDHCLRKSPERQAELLAARDCLLAPLPRLNHLLALLSRSSPPPSDPKSWPGGNLGWAVQQTLASTQRLLDQGCPQSGLSRALWLNQLQPLQEQLQKQLGRLAQLIGEIETPLATWHDLSLDDRINLLSGIIPSLNYAYRWKNQTEEALFAIRLQSDS